MDLEVREYYEEKYPDISYFLLKFFLDTYYPERNDSDTIERFVKEMDPESIKDTIKEGKEVLQLNPFPWEWISSVTNKLVYDKKTKEWVEDEKLYSEWVTWMVEALEQEGRRVGKL